MKRGLRPLLTIVIVYALATALQMGAGYAPGDGLLVLAKLLAALLAAALVEMYNRDANDDKNEVAQNTARFIDERIAIINQELGTTEQELESFKRESGLTDLNSDAQIRI